MRIRCHGREPKKRKNGRGVGHWRFGQGFAGIEIDEKRLEEFLAFFTRSDE
jgi:hypothetical protein